MATDSTIQLFRKPADAQMAMQDAEAQVNLLTPIGGRIDHIPPLCAVSLRVVYISPDPGQKEVYKAFTPRNEEQRYSLGRVALSKISAAANVEWYPTTRTDDGCDPHYCEVQVMGRYTTHDGRVRMISATKAVDMREGSAAIEKMRAEAARNSRDAADEINGVRSHILSHAETKARHRALRDAFAIKPSYPVSDLQRPFVIPVLVFTGETDDPELRKIVATRMVEMAAGASSALYGSTTTERTQAPPQLSAPRRAPPVGSVPDEDDEDQDDDRPTRSDTRPTSTQAPRPSMGLPQAQQTAKAPDNQQPARPSLGLSATHSKSTPAGTQAALGLGEGTQQGARDTHSQAKGIPSFKFGDWKGIPFEELDVAALRYYQRATKASIGDPARQQYLANNQRSLVSIEARLTQMGQKP